VAFIDDNEDELGQAQGETQGPQIGQGSNLVSGGQGGASAGQGAGAGNGWTNIQAYLNANKGDTGSAQALSNTVNSQFGQEREKMTGDANKFVSDAETQNKNSIIGTSQADQYINQAGDLYRYDDKGTTGGKTTFGPGESAREKVTPGQEYTPATYDNGLDYGGVVNKMKSFLGGSYAGPKEYNYGFDTKTQNYGNNLKDNGGFDSLMNSVYANAAQKPLTSGQFQLQKQFDVNNQALSDARQNLSSGYDQLVSDRDKTVSDTTAKLGGLEEQYRNAQTGLTDYLGKQGNSYQAAIDRAESDARKSYNDSYKGDESYRSNALAGYTNPNDRLRNAGVWGDDGRSLTWEQLQREQNIVNDPNGLADYNDIRRGDTSYSAVAGQKRNYAGNTTALNDFYTAQDNKYANTADAEERRWNAIQDFLGTGAKRKEQGFKVRG